MQALSARGGFGQAFNTNQSSTLDTEQAAEFPTSHPKSALGTFVLALGPFITI